MTDVHRCDSCGDATDDLLEVRRAYVVTDAAGEQVLEVQEGVERWCFPCRSLYPHQEVGPA